jgi:hypothetical protein
MIFVLFSLRTDEPQIKCIYWVMDEENLEGRDHFVDVSVDGMILLKWILEKLGCEHVDHIQLTQNRVKLLALVC